MKSETTIPRVLLATIVLTVPLASMRSGDEGQVRPNQCTRNPERAFPVGSVTTIAADTPPCRIKFRETGVRLAAVADGSRPDPGRTVVVDSNGRYLLANARGWPGVISVWDSRGKYLSSFGRTGDGPGEFTVRGTMHLFVDNRDNLHVFDGGFAWSVFNPEQELVTRTGSYSVTGLHLHTAVLDDGTVLASEDVRDRSNYFRIVDRAGEVQAAFAEVQGGVRQWAWRPISYAGGDAFWAGPPVEGGDAYVLEEWGTDRELRRTLRRDAPWFRWAEFGEISPVVTQLHVTHDGLLYVIVRRPTEEYLREFERARARGESVPREEREGLTDILFEVIDTRSGELLASELHPASLAREFTPRSLFRGMLRGYRYKEDEANLPFVEIVEVELVPR